MTKYRDYVKRMLEANSEFFHKFREAHDRYSLNQNKFQAEFNAIGKEALLIFREWEGKLCKHSESAGYSTFSGNLAGKFQDEIRKAFPMVDWIGVISKSLKPKFVIKKIDLSRHPM